MAGPSSVGSGSNSQTTQADLASAEKSSNDNISMQEKMNEMQNRFATMSQMLKIQADIASSIIHNFKVG